jgi:hypothetical protein
MEMAGLLDLFGGLLECSLVNSLDYARRDELGAGDLESGAVILVQRDPRSDIERCGSCLPVLSVALSAIA